MIQQFKSRQFLAFLITGGLAASVNFCSRMLYSLKLDYPMAIVLAYLTGMVTAFVLARLFVFKESQQPLRHSAMYFVLVNLVAVAQTWAISMLLAYHVLPAMGIRRFVPEIAHAIGVVVPVFTSYLGHKRWSFQ
ncbi:MAG: GtrA family protein [Rhodocyclales bacterium]|jgi:putative flippase GtrA|nr:GtrA family protein [Rhodocyclales bacterium]MBH1975051.1 GtrA family protein [Rhodocyclales bacterium]MBT9462220.1 GtrA family protein [Rugosibacter sp.]